MENLIKKITDYDILNILIPGAIFTEIIKIQFNINFSDDLLTKLLLYYFSGLMISRIGSLLVEFSLMHVGLLKKVSYSNYCKAELINGKITTLNTYANMYRAYTAGFIVLTLLSVLYRKNINLVIDCRILLSIALLFAISYIKQVNYISKNVENTLKSKQ